MAAVGLPFALFLSYEKQTPEFSVKAVLASLC